MIHVICGLIGAGKSTYAHGHYDYVTEYEEYGSKADQIKATLQYHACHGGDIAHITCYPSSQELDVFASLHDVEWIMIDTDPLQAKKNIIKRHRATDMINIYDAMRKNDRLWDRLLRSDIDFIHKTIFETEEKW